VAYEKFVVGSTLPAIGIGHGGSHRRPPLELSTERSERPSAGSSTRLVP
jgi:hypothetical protein